MVIQRYDNYNLTFVDIEIQNNYIERDVLVLYENSQRNFSWVINYIYLLRYNQQYIITHI